ncbi:hypothetical protein [Streptomyces sp. NPDC003077]|uniref:CTP synthase C-terminal region-related (seleno)protein n=1 Tax=Streptomyces sp. NPDC003077 TaxID=3154443 RepID=UPI0033B064C2
MNRTETATPTATAAATPTAIRPAAARLALVGDRSPNVTSHVRVPGLLDVIAERGGPVLDAYWIPTTDAAAEGALDGFDAIWLLPGSPYASEAGAVAAVRTARERGTPFLGTCGGFQHTLLEFARNVCGLTDAAHAENDPTAKDPLIAPLACSLVGHEGRVHLAPDSLARRAVGADHSMERYHCNYGAEPSRLGALRAAGLHFTGTDDEGQPRIAELPGHPFFLATLFQPELAGDGHQPHPLLHALADAAAAHAAAR